MKKSVKIIQILQDEHPESSHNTIFGLGDDGVVYVARWTEGLWRVFIPLTFASEPSSRYQ